MRDERVPTERLRPILDRFCERFGNREHAILELARRSGVRVRLVKGVLRGGVESLDFYEADRLLGAAGELIAWYGPLRDLYFGPKEARAA